MNPELVGGEQRETHLYNGEKVSFVKGEIVLKYFRLGKHSLAPVTSFPVLNANIINL